MSRSSTNGSIAWTGPCPTWMVSRISTRIQVLTGKTGSTPPGLLAEKAHPIHLIGSPALTSANGIPIGAIVITFLRQEPACMPGKQERRYPGMNMSFPPITRVTFNSTATSAGMGGRTSLRPALIQVGRAHRSYRKHIFRFVRESMLDVLKYIL